MNSNNECGLYERKIMSLKNKIKFLDEIIDDLRKDESKRNNELINKLAFQEICFHSKNDGWNVKRFSRQPLFVKIGQEFVAVPFLYCDACGVFKVELIKANIDKKVELKA